MHAGRLALGRRYGLSGGLGLLRHHQRAQLGVGGQHAVEADQVQPGPGHQRRQPLHELQRAPHQVRGAVAPGVLSFSTTWPAALVCTRSLANAEPGHKQSSGLFVPGKGPGLWPGAACKAVG